MEIVIITLLALALWLAHDDNDDNWPDGAPA